MVRFNSYHFMVHCVNVTVKIKSMLNILKPMLILRFLCVDDICIPRGGISNFTVP